MNKALVPVSDHLVLNIDTIAAEIEQQVRPPDGVRITPTGIIGLDKKIPIKRLVGLTCRLLRCYYENGFAGQTCLYAIGDAVNAGERQWGSTYEDMMAATGYAYQTIADAAWVTGKVPFSLRRENLCWTHHKAVASRKTPGDVDYWLDRAESEEMSTRELSTAIQRNDDLDDGKDPDVEQVKRTLTRALDAMKALGPEQWANVIVTALVRPLRHECADVEYEAFVAQLWTLTEEVLQG